jgi:CTP:molybdopterin cytidylyltransferase MocA
VIAGLVLAGGAGRRFGGGKLLAELDGRPLLEHALAAMEAATLDRTVVVLGADADDILARVHLHGAEPVVCEEWEEGQSASLREGVEALAGAEAVVVTLGDQPRLSPRAIERVVAARAPGVEALRATYGGMPGHPVLLERPLLARIHVLHGDTGARELLARARVEEVACDGLGSAADVDTPAHLEALR